MLGPQALLQRKSGSRCRQQVAKPRPSLGRPLEGSGEPALKTVGAPRPLRPEIPFFLLPSLKRARSVRSERRLVRARLTGCPRVGSGYRAGTGTAGAFAAVDRGLGPPRPPWATAAGARRHGVEWRPGPAELAHELLTPFVWDIKNSCGGARVPVDQGPAAAGSSQPAGVTCHPVRNFTVGLLNTALMKDDRL